MSEGEHSATTPLVPAILTFMADELVSVHTAGVTVQGFENSILLPLLSVRPGWIRVILIALTNRIAESPTERKEKKSEDFKFSDCCTDFLATNSSLPMEVRTAGRD